MGVIADKAWETCVQREPDMLPESSMRKIVSKVRRKVKRSSAAVVEGVGEVERAVNSGAVRLDIVEDDGA